MGHKKGNQAERGFQSSEKGKEIQRLISAGYTQIANGHGKFGSVVNIIWNSEGNKLKKSEIGRSELFLNEAEGRVVAYIHGSRKEFAYAEA